MGKAKLPSTPALRLLRSQGINFAVHHYAYQERGGTKVSSHELGVSEHAVVKTLIFEDDKRQPLVVLMHGDRAVSTKSLARLLKVKTVVPCKPEIAERHSGYRVGGTSPFGLRKPMPIYVEASIFELEKIWINGGQRGLLVEINPASLEDVLSVIRVEVGTD